MIAPAQTQNLQVKPRWVAPVGVMESVVAYNCRKYSMPLPVFAMPLWAGAGNQAIDLSGGGEHGTLTNGSSWVAEGLNFVRANTQYVSIGYDFLPTSDITVFIDFQVDAVAASSAVFGVRNENVASQRCSIHAPHSDSNIYWDYGGDASGTSRLVVAAPAGFVGDRVKMCFTAEIGIGMNIYHQGSLLASHAGNVPTRNVGGDFWVGGCYFRDTVIRYHNNNIYNICIFPEVLTPEQCKFISDDPYFLYRLPEELYGYSPAVVGAIMNQFQKANIGADLYNGALVI